MVLQILWKREIQQKTCKKKYGVQYRWRGPLNNYQNNPYISGQNGKRVSLWIRRLRLHMWKKSASAASSGTIPWVELLSARTSQSLNAERVEASRHLCTDCRIKQERYLR